LQLRRIIEDLTNLRYLQANETELTRQPIALDELFTELLADIQSLAEAKGHRLKVECEPGLRANVDRIRLGMAISNILVNAIRFTPDGGEITLRAQARDGQQVLISVEDNGIGLTQEQIERIFDKFYQVEDHMVRHHGGLGIGLSIARALVKAHGGRIWAESEGLNRGATLSILLPLSGEKSL
jgi:histidine kinase